MPNPNVGLFSAFCVTPAHAGCVTNKDLNISATIPLNEMTRKNSTRVTGYIERRCTDQPDSTGKYETTVCPMVEIETFCGAHFLETDPNFDPELIANMLIEVPYDGLGGPAYSNGLVALKHSGIEGDHCYARIFHITDYDPDHSSMAPQYPNAQDDWWLPVSFNGFWGNGTPGTDKYGSIDACQTHCQNYLMYTIENWGIEALLALFFADK